MSWKSATSKKKGEKNQWENHQYGIKGSKLEDKLSGKLILKNRNAEDEDSVQWLKQNHSGESITSRLAQLKEDYQAWRQGKGCCTEAITNIWKKFHKQRYA